MSLTANERWQLGLPKMSSTLGENYTSGMAEQGSFPKIFIIPEFLTPKYFLRLRPHSLPLRVSPPRLEDVALLTLQPGLRHKWLTSQTFCPHFLGAEHSVHLRQTKGREGCDSVLGNGRQWAQGQGKKCARPEATR